MKQQPKAKTVPAETVAVETAAAEAADAESGPVAASEESLPLKLAIELGPLLVFFLTNALYGIYAGTAAFMAATVLSLGIAWLRYRKIPVMPLVSGVIVMAFGALTLYLHDDTFIKLKPTIVYTMFAVLLAGGLVFKRHLLELLFGPVFKLSEEGWRKLTLRWSLFFVAMAVLNEVVWRNFSTDFWVNFKVFGFLPLTFLFAMAQVPLMQRHALPEAEDAPPGDGKRA